MYINISKVDFGKYYRGGGVTPEPEPDYLCFTSTGDSTVAMHQEGTPNTSANKVIQYKLNDGQWQTWDLSAVTLHVGDKMYLKSADQTPMCESWTTYKKFVMTGSIRASGNIMSLLNFSTTLPDSVFYYLFIGCTSLTTAPELPATTLTSGCYSGMFSGCTSLTTAPELPATTLADACYYEMFKGCTSLTAAPALPASTLAISCYSNMFNGCTSLITAPELPGTHLFEYSYEAMFSGCTSLTTAPELPATNLIQSCYYRMFENCTSLVQAPELPATQLAPYCYMQMFSGCSNLNYVKAMFTDIPSYGNPVGSWLNNVSPTGTFDKSKDATWTNEQAGIPTGWTILVEGVVPPEPEPDYLCFTSNGDSTVSMKQTGTPNKSANKVIQYKLNNGQWQNWDMSAVTLSDGDKMYLKSDDEIPVSESNEIFKQFVMTGAIAASGNTMSLLNFSATLTDYAFSRMFKDCTSLTATPAIPATTLAGACYAIMFEGCTSLTTAPALPATTLQISCYMQMFSGCTSLTTAPELPATELVQYCYSRMFEGCTKLNYVKAMFTNIISNALFYWLQSVSETGTVVKNAAATWTNEQAKIPTGWTVQTASPDK